MLRDEFVETLNAIKEELIIITLDDGSKHIVWRWSVYCGDLLTVEYVEVHAISTGNRMRVLYAHATNVTPYSLESMPHGMGRSKFMEKMNAICARAVGEDHRTIITLTDGAIHIAPTHTVVYNGSERTTYGEVRLKARVWMMSAPYSMIKDVVPHRPVKLVEG